MRTATRLLADFPNKSFAIMRELLAEANRVDIAAGIFLLRNWLDLQTRFQTFMERGGKLRVLLARNARGVSPEAVQALRRLQNTQVAFVPEGAESPPLEMHACCGRQRTVLTSAPPPGVDGFSANGSTGAMLVYSNADCDEEAQRARARFEGWWASARLATAKALADFAAATEQIYGFAQRDLVRSTNPMYKPYGVGRVRKVRNGMAKIEFNPSVFMEPPYPSENKILPVGELEKVETPLDRGARGEWEPAWRFELRMLAAS